jgi:hypothetical protein
MDLLGSLKNLASAATDRLETEAEGALADLIADAGKKPAATTSATKPKAKKDAPRFVEKSPAMAAPASTRPAWVIPLAVGSTVLLVGAVGWKLLGSN